LGGPQTDEVGDKEKEAAAAGEEAAWRQGKLTRVGDGFNGRPDHRRSFVIAAPGQSREAFGAENFANGGGAQGAVAIFERLADFINGMVLLTELHDEVVGSGLFWLGLGAVARGDEEGGRGVTAEVVAQDVQGAQGIAEGAGDFLGGAALNQESPQSVVLALLGEARFEEKPAEFI